MASSGNVRKSNFETLLLDMAQELCYSGSEHLKFKTPEGGGVEEKQQSLVCWKSLQAAAVVTILGLPYVLSVDPCLKMTLDVFKKHTPLPV